MLYYRKFVKDVWLIALVEIIIRFKGIILLSILTKSMGTESYGIWTQIIVTVSFLGPLLLLGLPIAIIRFLPTTKNKEEIREQIWSATAFTTAITLIVASIFLIFAQQIGELLQIPLTLIFLLAIILIFKSINSIFLSVFQAFQEIGKFATFSLILAAGETALVATFISMGYGLFGAVFSIVLIHILVFLIMLIVILKKVGVSLPNFTRIKEYLALSIPLVISSTSYWIVQAGDRYLIVGFLGILFVGYYAPAYALALIINIFLLPIGLILPATLSKLFAENKIQEIQIFLTKSLKYTLLLTIPAAFGLIVLSNELLTIFTTKEIAENSSSIMPFVVTSVVLYGVYNIFSHIMFLFKKTKITGTIWVGVAILNIILNILLIPSLGILGAAIATIIAYIIALSLTWYISQKYLRFPIDWLSIVKSIIAAFIMATAIAIFHPVGLIQTLIAMTLGALIYGILIFILKAMHPKEIKFFKELLLSTIQK